MGIALLDVAVERGAALRGCEAGGGVGGTTDHRLDDVPNALLIGIESYHPSASLTSTVCSAFPFSFAGSFAGSFDLPLVSSAGAAPAAVGGFFAASLPTRTLTGESLDSRSGTGLLC